ncbi:uncharacterized protein B0H64DRAFT_322698 [Chaetomium fimeti]|uniref:SET domain-containing protein n=1 Tax=Chaetomium fimeti TaxID=1854472 RepID=A0AAE0HFS4_9PEZI|nr:hypothetical protein B0H64DRAFT_322698 [Chaetomium fimeti]
MRKSLHFLVLFARSLLAHSDLGQTEIYGLGTSLIPSGDLVCLVDLKHEQCQDGNCDRSEQHVWTHSSPCFQGDHAEQPICVFTNTRFADGRGISLVTTPKRASYLASSPAFTNPESVHGINQDLHPTVPTKYEMRHIPGKGMGLIATAPIPRGEQIMANTASLMIDYRAFNELTREQYTALQAHAVARLPPDHAAAILALSPDATTNNNNNSTTRADLIDAIAATNGFDIDPTPTDPDQHHSFFVLFPAIARMNHDCRPSAEYRYTPPHLAQVVVAARDILPGEELTLSYINPLMVRARRVGRLKKNWGFECGCALCALEGARRRAADGRVERIAEVRRELAVWPEEGEVRGRTGRASPEMGELLVGLYEMERLWGSMHEAYAMAALEFSGVGDAWTAVRYASLGLEWGIPMLGEEDEEVEELRSLAEDPWGHWSWMKRVVGEEGEGEGRV